MKITVMTADEQIVTLDVDRDESVIPPTTSLSLLLLLVPLKITTFYFLSQK